MPQLGCKEESHLLLPWGWGLGWGGRVHCELCTSLGGQGSPGLSPPTGLLGPAAATRPTRPPAPAHTVSILQTHQLQTQQCLEGRACPASSVHVLSLSLHVLCSAVTLMTCPSNHPPLLPHTAPPAVGASCCPPGSRTSFVLESGVIEFMLMHSLGNGALRQTCRQQASVSAHFFFLICNLYIF